MKYAIIEISTGRIDTIRKSDGSPTSSIPAADPGFVSVAADDGVTPDTHYGYEFAPGEWSFALRPKCTQYPETATAPFDLTLIAGEEIKVRAEDGTVTEATSADPMLTIVDAGRVRVWIKGAFPSTRWSGWIEVSE